MDRIMLTGSADIPVTSPVLRMREFEFQVAALHRENDELRLLLDQKNQEVTILLAEKSNFEREQEEAEKRYMELEDRCLELEKQIKRGGTSPLAYSTTAQSSYSSSSLSPNYNYNNNGNNSSPSPLGAPLGSSQSVGRWPIALSSSQAISPSFNNNNNNNTVSPLSTSQSIHPPLPASVLNNNSSLSSSTSVVPSMNTGATRGKNNSPALSPTLTSCVGDSSQFEVSVVPSPTPTKKSRKKSIISLFSL